MLLVVPLREFVQGRPFETVSLQETTRLSLPKKPQYLAKRLWIAVTAVRELPSRQVGRCVRARPIERQGICPCFQKPRHHVRVTAQGGHVKRGSVAGGEKVGGRGPRAWGTPIGTFLYEPLCFPQVTARARPSQAFVVRQRTALPQKLESETCAKKQGGPHVRQPEREAVPSTGYKKGRPFARAEAEAWRPCRKAAGLRVPGRGAAAMLGPLYAFPPAGTTERRAIEDPPDTARLLSKIGGVETPCAGVLGCTPLPPIWRKIL